METEMSEWNYNIDEAPKSQTTTKRIKTKEGFEDRKVEIPVRIIGCVDNPEKWVAVTWWQPPNRFVKKGRWAGLTEDQNLLAWMHKPAHPKADK